MNVECFYKEQTSLINDFISTNLNDQQKLAVCKFIVNVFYKRNNFNTNDNKFDKVVDSLMKRDINTVLEDLKYILNK